MTWTLTASGTQTATISTEHTLSTSTVNATFVFEVDLSTLVLGDNLELRVKGITLSAGSATQIWKATFNGVQTNPTVQSPPIASDISLAVTLKQLTGTGRAFPWKLLSV